MKRKMRCYFGLSCKKCEWKANCQIFEWYAKIESNKLK